MTSTRRYGPYEIRRRLGGGAMGEVFLAWDPRMGRQIALKILGKERARDRSFVDRFVREARAAGSLEHQNVVGVYDWGTVEGEFYIAMQYVDGEDLDDILYTTDEEGARRPRFRPLPVQIALAMARDVLLGLEHLHEHGVIHRDLKPANVMLSRTGTLKITDFGLARRTEDSIRVTIGPQSLGTPSHMSPEAAAGRTDLDARADLFSMGVLAFELFAGQCPFHGGNIAAMLFAIQTQEPPELRALNPLVPEPVAAVVHRMLVKDREKRCGSAREARLLFDRALADQGVLSTADLLREFVEQPRSLVERLYVGSREEHLNRGAFMERQGTDHIQDAVDSYSLVLFIDPAHAEARSRFERLVHESSGGSRPLPLRVPQVPPPAEQATWIADAPGRTTGPAPSAVPAPSGSGLGVLGPDASVGTGPLIAPAESQARRGHGRRIAAALAGIAVVAALAWGGWRLAMTVGDGRGPDRPRTPATGSETRPDRDATGPIAEPAVGGSATPPAVRPVTPPGSGTTAAPPATSPRKPAVGRAASPATAPRERPVSAGPTTAPAPPVASSGCLRVQKMGLTWGIIYLDDVSTGREHPALLTDLQPREYLVSVRREGYRSAAGDLRVRVRAGETTTVVVSLRPVPPR